MMRIELTNVSENMVKCFILIKERLKITAVRCYPVPRNYKVSQHQKHK